MQTSTPIVQTPSAAPLRLRRHLLVAAAALCTLPAFADTAYPSKPITIVLGNSAGSGGDLLCRVLATGLSAALKQTVIVDNRVGANSTIASMAVVNAKPDGYTLAVRQRVQHGDQPGRAEEPALRLAHRPGGHRAGGRRRRGAGGDARTFRPTT